MPFYEKWKEDKKVSAWYMAGREQGEAGEVVNLETQMLSQFESHYSTWAL